MATRCRTEAMRAAMNQDDLQHKRARAVRTAWVLAVVAAAIFVGFILTGITGR